MHPSTAPGRPAALPRPSRCTHTQTKSLGEAGPGRGLAWGDGQDKMKLDRSPEYRERASLENLCDENFIGTGNGKALALGYK